MTAVATLAVPPAPAPAQPTPITPNGLLAADLAMFATIGVSIETLIANGIRRISAAQAKNDHGITSYGSGGILYVARNPLTGAESCRLRRDGTVQPKYLAAKGALRTFFFPSGSGALLQKNPLVPLLIIESEKSALSLWDWSKRAGREIVPVGIGGVWSWRGRHLGPDGTIKPKGPLPDLAVAAGRVVNLCFDSNIGNPDVAAARNALVRELHKLKASEIRVCDLPAMPTVNGPDDYIAVAGDAAMMVVFDSATLAPPASAMATEFSEDALALAFTAKYRDDFRFVQSRGTWYGWDGARWKPDETGVTFSVIREICREAASAKGDPHLASARCIAAVERIARSDNAHAATTDVWDQEPWLLNTPAGTIDLRIGEMREHRREDYLTKMTSVAPGGDCTLWLQFLNRITAGDGEMQAHLQKLCGYALTADVSESKIWFLTGVGGNGKSVLCNTFLGLLSDYGICVPSEVFMSSTTDRHPTELARMRDTRLIISSEIEPGKRWNESRIKALTGSERITARRMREDFSEFAPTGKIIICGNSKPALRDTGEATRRRLVLLPFNVVIPESERDPRLLEKLKAEWPGVLAWAIQGCLAWQRDGLKIPATATTALDDYLHSEDACGRWREDRCLTNDPKGRTPVNVLYQDWKEWCDSRGEFAASIKAFSQSLEKAGFVRYNDGKTRGFDGIRLRYAYQPPEMPRP